MKSVGSAEPSQSTRSRDKQFWLSFHFPWKQPVFNFGDVKLSMHENMKIATLQNTDRFTAFQSA